MGKKAYLAFGSNTGEPEDNIYMAYESLALVPGISTVRLSSLYITKPWGFVEQNDFVNACCEIDTTLSPEALLGVCLGMEAAMGRIRSVKNGPRIIDIDVLMYEGEVRNTTELVLPHPRMKERQFVIVPLNDLASDGLVLDLNTAALVDKTGNCDTPGAVVKAVNKCRKKC